MLSVAWLLFFAGESKYEANLDFVFSCADENAQIENERMKRQIETSRKRFLSKTSLQRTRSFPKVQSATLSSHLSLSNTLSPIQYALLKTDRLSA
jgi:hypothetical protein